MSFARPLIGDRGSVALEHRPGLPSRQPHQVGLATALTEPEVGEGVPEQVGVQVLDAGLAPPAAQELGDAGGGHAALAGCPVSPNLAREHVADLRRARFAEIASSWLSH
jgi:hypothetical protein